MTDDTSKTRDTGLAPLTIQCPYCLKDSTSLVKDGEIVWDPALDDAGIVGPHPDSGHWVAEFLARRLLQEGAYIGWCPLRGQAWYTCVLPPA
ncbi:MAG: hypothetical protein OXI12_13955 [Gammaproteobacteria bacterium]|nr:hypothetical protein [Gammaproteobacteria bacterium]